LQHDATMLQIFIIACNAQCTSQTRARHGIKSLFLDARKYRIRKLIAAVPVVLIPPIVIQYPPFWCT